MTSHASSRSARSGSRSRTSLTLRQTTEIAGSRGSCMFALGSANGRLSTRTSRTLSSRRMMAVALGAGILFFWRR